jgi:hypothetical protein
MTTPPDRAALMDAGRAYLERWSVWLRQNPAADPAMVEAAMRRGDPPPELVSFDVDTAVFNDSPLSAVYYNVKNELKQRNNGRAAASHHRIALWAAWEAHKTAKDSHGVSLLRLVGLPETQKAFAEFLGVSDRTVRNYRDEYGEFVGTAQTMTFNRLLADYRLDAAQALGQVATDKAHPQFAQSQRTFFTLTGDLVDKQDITSGGEKVQQITVIREDRNAVTSADDETE